MHLVTLQGVTCLGGSVASPGLLCGLRVKIELQTQVPELCFCCQHVGLVAGQVQSHGLVGLTLLAQWHDAHKQQLCFTDSCLNVQISRWCV